MPVQKFDVYANQSSGIYYAGPDLKWVVAENTFVSSAYDGVRSVQDHSKLVNKGDILGFASGVNFAAEQDGTVINKAGASIAGSTGIAFGSATVSNNMTMINDGSILGFASYGVKVVNVSNFDLHNTGEIAGSVGILVHVDSLGAKGPMIENSGVIKGDFAIASYALPWQTTTIVNEVGGTIEGSFGAISSHGILSLDNHGTIKGGIRAGGPASDDKVVNAANIRGDLYLDDGYDTFKNAGGRARMVHGGDGNDKLVAGASKDTFVFDTALNAATNVDRVMHFKSGKDEFYLDDDIFTALTGLGALTDSEFHVGKHAADADDHVIYHKNSGALYYDADGNGDAMDQVQFAKLDKGQSLSSSDFVVVG